MTTREWFRILRGSMWAGADARAELDCVFEIDQIAYSIDLAHDGYRMEHFEHVPPPGWGLMLQPGVAEERRAALPRAEQLLAQAFRKMGYVDHKTYAAQARMRDLVRRAFNDL